MKIDLYTKIVLSLIAAALTVLACRSLQDRPAVLAQQSGPQHVIIDGLNAGGSFIPVKIDGLPVHEGGVVYPGQPVVIKGIDLGKSKDRGIPVYLVDKPTNLP